MAEDHAKKDFLQKLLSTLRPGKTSSIYDKGKTTVPESSRDHLKAVDGDSLMWYNIPGPFALVKKLTAITFVALLACAALVPAAYAQQSGPTPVPEGGPKPVTEDELEETPIDLQEEPAGTPTADQIETDVTEDGLPLYPIKQLGPNKAFTPFRLQVTYDSGEEIIPQVEKVDPNSAVKITAETPWPEPGRTTTTFETSAIDSFRLIIGQKYSAPVTQVVQIVAWANNEEMYRETLPFIERASVKIEIRFTTAVAPHFPTPEENLSVVVTPLNEVKAEVTALKENVEGFGAGIVSTGGLFQGAMVFFLVLVSMQALQFFQNRHYMHILENKENEGLQEISPEGENKK